MTMRALPPVFDDSDWRRAGRTARHIVHETEVVREWPASPSEAARIAANEDYPASKGCTSSFTPTWIDAIVSRKG